MDIGEELVVLSANCQGLQNKSKRRDVLDYLSKTRDCGSPQCIPGRDIVKA